LSSQLINLHSYMVYRKRVLAGTCHNMFVLRQAARGRIRFGLVPVSTVSVQGRVISSYSCDKRHRSGPLRLPESSPSLGFGLGKVV
jgi:hypothetical protein